MLGIAAAQSFVSCFLTCEHKTKCCCAGLLTTEAGTLGRFSGNIVMSVVARLTGVETSQELLRFGMTLYGIFAALLLLIGFYMLAVWRKLAT